MEERNMIGNELHDSLAQSLVGMRLQVKMLGETLHKKDVRRAQEEARRLRIAVEEAHASLRELLANFRLRIDERGLVPAIESMVRRANQEPGLTVFFHNDCERLSLTPAQEIQVYHIVQEALTNIRKHANARNARIQLGTTSDGRYSMLIEDDGDGIAHTEPEHPGEQIGLAIMRQRAERLPGELTIESEPGEGTRVFLTFSAVNGEIAKQAYGS
jgi:two-component system nitrate/nitrite sensor histidine kinase NarX